jgi:DNA-binding beta-propeller fold protein YncE
LSPLTGSPFPTEGGNSIAIEKSGNYLYLANGTTVDGYTLVSGVPMPMAGSPFVAGPRATALTVDSSGAFVYVLDNDMSGVTVLQIDPATGALSIVNGSPFALIAGSTTDVGASDIVVSN